MDKLSIILERLRTYRPEKVIVFGSVARNEADPSSDIDLVVIRPTKERFIQRLVRLAQLIGPDLGKIDIFVYTPAEFETMKQQHNHFIERVLQEGRVIYEKK